MKTIEERAEYLADYVLENVDPADALLFRKLITESYMVGAEDKREELTRWHDPKKELPKDERIVLTRKAKDGEWGYMVAGYSSEIRKWVTTYHKVYVDMGLSPLDVEDYLPDGWREIHE